MPSFNFGTKILIVENEGVARAIIKGKLRILGYKDIEEAGDGDEAWKKLTASLVNHNLVSIRPIPNLILCDLHMPKMSGIDLLKKIRTVTKSGKEEDDETKEQKEKRERLENIAFIMITSDTEQKSVVAAVKSGVDNYLGKPITEESLRTSLSNAYEKFTERMAKINNSEEKIFRRK